MGYVQLLDIELLRLRKEVSYQLLLWQDQFSIGVKGYLPLDQNYGAYCQLNVFRNYLFKNYLFFEHFNFIYHRTGTDAGAATAATAANAAPRNGSH